MKSDVDHEANGNRLEIEKREKERETENKRMWKADTTNINIWAHLAHPTNELLFLNIDWWKHVVSWTKLNNFEPFFQLKVGIHENLTCIAKLFSIGLWRPRSKSFKSERSAVVHELGNMSDLKTRKRTEKRMKEKRM